MASPRSPRGVSTPRWPSCKPAGPCSPQCDPDPSIGPQRCKPTCPATRQRSVTPAEWPHICTARRSCSRTSSPCPPRRSTETDLATTSGPSPRRRGAGMSIVDPVSQPAGVERETGGPQQRPFGWPTMVPSPPSSRPYPDRCAGGCRLVGPLAVGRSSGRGLSTTTVSRRRVTASCSSMRRPRVGLPVTCSTRSDSSHGPGVDDGGIPTGGGRRHVGASSSQRRTTGDQLSEP
jgi:hypothetical protein